ncbi:CD3324 family protein [Paenibacillus gorillae]|uniref:CD3324 family protein n=1 Tax=Paenibacillus gorillae TaxID=1243662 RepID=UPI0004B6DD59|nr:CD3324 family protein [Paenibacillus gorillae]
MKYTNASKVLPEELIIEIQKYVQGETLYIPKQQTEYKHWGSLSGGRRMLDQRNNAIRMAFMNNKSIEQLAADYFLSTDTIKRIVYSHKK